MPDARETRADWDRVGIRIAGGYLAYFGAIGALMPFAALYFRELGFSGVQVGVLTALPALGAAVFGPIWGAVSDALGIHQWVLRVALGLTAVVAFATAQPSTFVPVVLLYALLSFVSVPVAPLLDSYGITAGERAGRSFGRIRLWGSVGYMAAVLTVGWLMGDDVSSLLLIAHGTLAGLALISVLRLPPLAERRSMPLLGGVRQVLGRRPMVLLLIVAYLLAIGAALINTYLGVRIEEIGGSASLVGVAFAVASASELPVIVLSGWLLRTLGASRLVAIAIAVYAVRFIAFSLISAPEWSIPFQALHGFSYGAFMMASMILAHRQAGEQHAATAQALLTAVSLGFGSITGALVGGALLDVIGTAGIFRGAAVLMVVTLAVLVVGNRAVSLDRARSTA